MIYFVTLIRKLGLLGVLIVPVCAQAAMVNFSVTGFATDNMWNDGTPDGFGLSSAPNDTITAVGTFDNVSLDGSGLESVLLDSLTITVGNAIFTQDDETRATNFPVLLFDGGAFDGIDFDALYGDFGYFNSAERLMTFTGDDDNFGSIYGNWDGASYSVSAVPVPAAAWLFGSGLIALAGFVRRKK